MMQDERMPFYVVWAAACLSYILLVVSFMVGDVWCIFHSGLNIMYATAVGTWIGTDIIKGAE
jgi:hypothetical protein